MRIQVLPVDFPAQPLICIWGFDVPACEAGALGTENHSPSCGGLYVACCITYEQHIAPIFDARCSGCHGADGIADLRLDSAEGVAGTALGIPSTGWPEWNRITTSRPGESYLLYKIIGDERISGLPMPRSWDEHDPAPPLTADEQEAISDWIASGTAFFDQRAGGQ